MTRPSAPILTADYYTYSTYSQREDFYGGFEPKNENDTVQYHPNAGPVRMEPVICKNKSRKSEKNVTTSIHCIAFLYCVLGLTGIFFNIYFYYYGIRNKVIYYITGVMGFIVLTSLMMHIGTARRQPFLCIPFVVCRTMEVFTCLCLVIVFFYSLIYQDHEFYKFMFQCSKFFVSVFPQQFQFNLLDITFQFCAFGLFVFLIALSVSMYVCRVSFECTMWVADQLREKRMQQTYDTSRVRIASDEFYCA